ncbi:MAG: DNA polymerase IV [Verrucomicrobia bacterium]|nr:DNA polymerase IV [Verrucomicrobiota bacterium]
MDRVFLHVDMDAFFASVEQRNNPELRGRPVVVGAAGDERGVVSAASYEARKFGIHSAMPSREAKRRCPHAVFVPVNGPLYSAVSKQILSIMERFTPLVEPLSIDEAFLDVTGSRRLYGDGPEIAKKIKSAIKEETGLTASVGVAPNKFLAKLASDMDKPDGLTVVPESPAAIREFLAPLPVRRIWGVGKVTGQILDRAGIHLVSDLQEISRERLGSIIGKHSAAHLTRLALGEDVREIELEYDEKSMSREYTFSEDCSDRARVEEILCDLVDDVAGRLRRAERYASVAHLKLRWKGFQTITRQKSFGSPCCDTFRFRVVALEMLRAQDLSKPVRLVGFGVSRLGDLPSSQLDLFGGPGLDDRKEKLSRTIDDIRSKYGENSIGLPPPSQV